MILFSIPDYFNLYALNLTLLDLMDEYPEKFYDDIKIDSIYGSFPCIWNGGRYLDGYTSYKNIKATVQPFMDRGLSIRHTFTNCLLTERHLTDTLCNKICELTEHPNNGINVNSQLMKDYLQQHYPQFYIMWSTTLCSTDMDQINKLSKDNLLVLDYNLNNNFILLQQLQHPENIEILVCETCEPNCPYRQMHYENESRNQLYEATEPFQCPFASPYFVDSLQQPHRVSIETIRKQYLPIGINKFKIMGRGRPAIETIENYIHYFVKPEHAIDIRNRLLLATR